ncbi:MAG: hypothetical protein ACREMF_05650 [Gemmatimonadales bacterium]
MSVIRTRHRRTPVGKRRVVCDSLPGGYHGACGRAPATRSLPLIACLVAGCHTYVPLPTPTPLPSTHVSAALTDSGSLELARLLGPRIVAVDGRVLSASERALVLAVFKTTNRTAEDVSWRGEVVALPPPLVAHLQARTFSKGRSLLLTGAVLIGSAAVVRFFKVGSTARGTGGGNKPPPR